MKAVPAVSIIPEAWILENTSGSLSIPIEPMSINKIPKIREAMEE